MPEVNEAKIVPATASFGRRRARALIGWLPVSEGALWLAGRQMNETPSSEHIEICTAARKVVARRKAGIDQSKLFSQCPTDVEQYVEELRRTPEDAQSLQAGGEVRMVDLRKICAAQPQILIEDAVKRVGTPDPQDARALAAITLPAAPSAQMPAVFDQGKNAWIVSSSNPNLRVRGNFNVQVGSGIPGFGFIVSIQSSYMQVSGLHGRYFLRDGYHRAYGLLAAGIYHVPALVRDFDTFEQVGLPVGLLPQGAYLGDRPPMLVDYLDDMVASDTTAPTTQTTIVVQALELRSLG